MRTVRKVPKTSTEPPIPTFLGKVVPEQRLGDALLNPGFFGFFGNLEGLLATGEHLLDDVHGCVG